MADPNNTERAIKSNRSYNTAAIGVISDGSSSFMINSHGGSADAPLTGKPLVLVGRVPVKVTNEGGTIRPGDLLTTASKPGYAMKATKAGPTVGTALGFFSGAEGEVLVFVNLGYHNSSPSDIQGDTRDIAYESLNVSGDAIINRLTVSSVTVSGNATVQGSLIVQGSASVGTLTVNGHLVTAGNVPQLELQQATGTNANASIMGNDTSGIVSITTGDNSSSGSIVKIRFKTIFGGDPRVVITAVGKESAKVQPYIEYANAHEFMLGIGQPALPGTTLKYNYQVMQ